MQEYYDVIFKRRSTRKYAETGLSDSELKAVKETLTQLVPLDSSIKTKFVIKQRTMTLAYLNHHNLNKFTINKAVQKCRDSFRVSLEDKEMLLKFKMK